MQELEHRRKIRKLELNKQRTEQNVLEEELKKLDDVANVLENFEPGNGNRLASNRLKENAVTEARLVCLANIMKYP